MKTAIAKADSYDEGVVRDAVARLFESLGYDASNPLGSIIKPGDRVFIKPNWVAHEYRASCSCQDSVYSTITHPMVVRVVAEHAAAALKGEGEILIGDNPSIDADFDKLKELAGLDDLANNLDVPVRLLDLRPLRCADLKDYGRKDRMTAQSGDPDGAVDVDLGSESMFEGINPRLFRGVFDDRTETIESHSGGRHLYSLSSSIANADVYISLPKLKTHHKCGVTLNLKGLVGAISNKNTLVHWRVGFPAIGGDEYPGLLQWVQGLFAETKARGAWSGNDTIWRMVIDIYRAFRKIRTRRCFSIVDGIIAGEGNGPFCPRSKDAGMLLAGEDLAAVDCCAARLMGFDVRQIPYIRHLLDSGEIDCDHIEVLSKDMDTDRFFDGGDRRLAFDPPTGWQNLLQGR